MKTQNPWMGRFRGSAGNMTGCKVYDKNVLRAKAFEVSNPNTPAQQNQRNFFKEVSEFTAMFSEEVMRALFPSKPKSMSRRNALSKQVAEDNKTVEGQKVVDYEHIDTLGNASTMDFGTTTCVNTAGTIAVGLDAAVKALTQYADNYMMCAVINETQGDIYFPDTNANVQTGTLSFAAPSNWLTTDSIHAIPFIASEKKDGKIALVGFGTLSPTKRPAKQG